jgi:hypothetical protein
MERFQNAMHFILRFVHLNPHFVYFMVKLATGESNFIMIGMKIIC